MQMSGVKKGDEHHRTRATILSLKKKYELLGIEQLKEKKNEILKEVA
jgi:hypothetical protein